MNIPTIIFIIFLFLFPKTVFLLTLLFFTIYKLKKERFLKECTETHKPTTGDILIFFGVNDTKNVIDSITWRIVPTIHTNYPIAHVALMIDNNRYIHVEYSKKVQQIHYLNDIHSKYNNRFIPYVIKTNVTHVDHRLLREKYDNVGYWQMGACLGAVNKYLHTINPCHTFCYSVEDFCKQYDGSVYKLDL